MRHRPRFHSAQAMDPVVHLAPVKPFRSGAEAWFWTIRTINARRSGAGERRAGDPRRPCEPEAILRILAALWTRRRITDDHARVLRFYGDRQKAPDLARAAERADHKTWIAAMVAMDWALRVKGIVA